MADRPSNPKLVVDNDPDDERRRRKAIRRLKKSKPDHSYDDVLAEADRLKKEEQENDGV